MYKNGFPTACIHFGLGRFEQVLQLHDLLHILGHFGINLLHFPDDVVPMFKQSTFGADDLLALYATDFFHALVLLASIHIAIDERGTGETHTHVGFVPFGRVVVECRGCATVEGGV